MRLSLLYNPFDVIERLAVASRRRRRFRRLRGTPAAALEHGHIDSLELLELLRPAAPAVIYDIGANIGTWTCLAKSLFPAARVEAFEPLGTHHAAFAQTAAPFANVHLHGVALGSAPAVLEMNVMDFSDASSFLPINDAASAEFHVHTARREAVPVVRLDDFRREHTLPPPDLISLDIQGFELEALRGAPECLRHARAVLCEVSFREYYHGQPLFHEIAAHLGAHGFGLRAVGANTPVGDLIGQTDALFLKIAP